ncbi:hypothetical protein BKA65DRAFT_485073 [Rhexocercosporidium sp. MPI-PUGE-AT-0058]|nr:hypothetical protein BKA65DRAFT_485073 [Rhexocercosporidium sp. MPI-PUGE-AT-0058]
MKQIIRNPDFRAAFDIQLDIPGLGGGMSLGSTQKLMLSYLDDNIKGFWTKIFQGDKPAMLKPPALAGQIAYLYTVRCEAARYLARLPGEREAIWTDILSETTGCLIPSLSSFFADIHYLKGPANCIKALVELWPDETVPSALKRIFSDANQETDRCIIQQSESTFISIPGNRSDRLELGVLQIWISAMRNYFEMLPEKRVKRLFKIIN